MACRVFCDGSRPSALVYGDPHPISRIGLTRDTDGEVVVVNVACPGERLRGIELERRVSADTVWATVWSATGDAPPSRRITIGADVPGLTTDTPLSEPLRPVKMKLTVTTNQLESANALRFNVDEVRRDSILSFDGQYHDHNAYREAVLEDTPCPDDRFDPWSVLKPMLFVGGPVQVGLGAIGIALLVLPRYRPPSTRSPQLR